MYTHIHTHDTTHTTTTTTTTNNNEHKHNHDTIDTDQTRGRKKDECLRLRAELTGKREEAGEYLKLPQHSLLCCSQRYCKLW